MKAHLLLSFLFLAMQCIGQTCTYTYFPDGKKSTERCVNDQHRGTARAFDQAGKVIGEWMLSRSGMMTSVRFSFHANGMVHQAYFNSQPDGGIQWYRSTTTFDANGVKTDFKEEDHDKMQRIMSPTPSTPSRKPQKKQPPKPKKSAPTYVSELWLDNRSNKHLLVQVVHNTTQQTQTYKIPKGTRLKVGELSLVQKYQDPRSKFSITIIKPSGKVVKEATYGALLLDNARLKEHHKGYVYDLE